MEEGEEINPENAKCEIPRGSRAGAPGAQGRPSPPADGDWGRPPVSSEPPRSGGRTRSAPFLPPPDNGPRSIRGGGWLLPESGRHPRRCPRSRREPVRFVGGRSWPGGKTARLVPGGAARHLCAPRRAAPRRPPLFLPHRLRSPARRPRGSWEPGGAAGRPGSPPPPRPGLPAAGRPRPAAPPRFHAEPHLRPKNPFRTRVLLRIKTLFIYFFCSVSQCEQQGM